MVFHSDQHADDPNPQNLLSWLFEKVPDSPERPLLIDATDKAISLSWLEIKTLVGKLAAGFRAHGLGEGDCLGIVGTTRNIRYFPSAYGAIGAGAVFHGIDPQGASSAGLNQAIKAVSVTHLLVEPDFVADAVDAVKSAFSGDMSRIFVFAEDDSGTPFIHGEHRLTSWSSLLSHGTQRWPDMRDLSSCKSTAALRITTSGSLTAGKIVEISHYAGIAHIDQWARAFETHAFDVTSMYYLGLHAILGFAFLTTAIKLDFPVYFIDRSIPGITAACKALKPTLMMIDPFTLMQLVKAVAQSDDSTALHSLRDVRAPSFQLPAEARKLAEKMLHPDCLISRPYGLTETGTISAMLYSQREAHDPDSVGYTFPGVLVKLVDERGAEITAYDQPGEILVKTPALLTNYYHNPVATDNAMRNGWYDTGDVGYISAKTKQWYLLGRKTTLFKIAGKYVNPEEIESVLASHHDIANAGVVPVPSATEGGDPRVEAFVVLREGAKLTVEDVKTFANSRLSPEQSLTGEVRSVGEIKRTPGSKIDRKALRELAEQHAAT